MGRAGRKYPSPILRSHGPQLAETFFALGDETRLSLLGRLRSRALTATALANGAQVSRQAIVRHLQVLDAAGLVTRERCGREVLYLPDARRIKEARAYLEMISASWDRAIDNLRNIVEGGTVPKKRRA